MEIPKSWTDLVGTTQTFSDYLLSYEKKIEKAEFNVLNIRWGTAKIVDENYKEIHPTVQLLVKKAGMKKAQWTKPFGVAEIKLNKKKKL